MSDDLVMDESWRICGVCEMPYENRPPAQIAHYAIKGHHALDSGPWTEAAE